MNIHETTDSSNMVSGSGSNEPALRGNGFTYRHNWGKKRGSQKLRLNWSSITPRSLVFVSIGEGAAGGPNSGKFIGAARYTLHNVAPRNGGVDIWVDINWRSNIPLYVDYLVINPPGSDLRTVSVIVHRHPTVSLTNADADRILADMGTTLQRSDSSPDVATPIRFVRSGSVRTLPANISGTIQTAEQWRALMAAGTGVKVVQAIRWCGGPGGSIIGCAPVGSARMNLAVVRFTNNQEGILWAHEYGHNTGSGHRQDDTRALMYPSIGSNHNVINQTESQRFLTGPQPSTAATIEAACCHDGEESMKPPADIHEFVTQHWFEGVPYGAASQYTETDAQQLIEMLVDEPEKYEEFLPEIVTTLCFIGSEDAVEPLINFVEGPLQSQSAFDAKNAALIHLGDLINMSGSTKAFDFLARMATSTESAKAVAKPRVSMQAMAAEKTDITVPELDTVAAELAVSAIFGLALSGTKEGQQVVEKLQSKPDLLSSVKLAAAEAEEIAQEVQSAKDQKEYYRLKSSGNKPSQ